MGSCQCSNAFEQQKDLVDYQNKQNKNMTLRGHARGREFWEKLEVRGGRRI